MKNIMSQTRVERPRNKKPPSIIHHVSERTKAFFFALFCKDCDMLERSSTSEAATSRWNATALERLRAALLASGSSELINASKTPRL